MVRQEGGKDSERRGKILAEFRLNANEATASRAAEEGNRNSKPRERRIQSMKRRWQGYREKLWSQKSRGFVGKKRACGFRGQKNLKM